MSQDYSTESKRVRGKEQRMRVLYLVKIASKRSEGGIKIKNEKEGPQKHNQENLNPTPENHLTKDASGVKLLGGEIWDK